LADSRFWRGQHKDDRGFHDKVSSLAGIQCGQQNIRGKFMVFSECACAGKLQQSSKRNPENPEFLEKFFRNLLLKEHNELKNRYLHIRAKDFLEIKEKNATVNYGKVTANNKSVTQNITENKKNITGNNESVPQNARNITVKLTQKQKDILKLIKESPHITQTEIALKLNIARETVNRNMKKLQEKKIIQRIGADKNGSWKILEEKYL